MTGVEQMMGFASRIAALFVACIGLACAQAHVPGAGLPSTTWNAGTKLAEFAHGGRITTFHRGLVYMGGHDNQATWIYDISNPQSPRLRCTAPTEGNSHVWYKIGDLFYRQNLRDFGRTPPLFADFSNFNLSASSNPCAWQQWTTPIYNFPVSDAKLGGDFWISTYPYAYGYTDYPLDPHFGWWPPAFGENAPRKDLNAEMGIVAGNRFRIANLLFFTPGDGQQGVAVFDIGDPASPRLLDVLQGNYLQYTTTWQVWRNYLVMLIGHGGNGPDANANALVVDFSDPTNLRVAWTIPLKPSGANTDNYMPGRYVHFQDHYAFAGHVADGRGGGHGVKYNMLTRKVEMTFDPSNTGTDFQWIPIGHLLFVSGSELSGSASAIFAHQNGLDRTPPTVGYHLPANNAVNQPRATVVGLVINELLDSTTVNEQTIQLRVLGGDPVPAIVMHTSYDVINVTPVSPLLADTTYEVRLVANGVRDVAGNGIAAKSFFFSTGNTVQAAPEIQSLSANPASPVQAGQSVAFNAVAVNATQFSWDFGDGSAPTAWAATPAANHPYATPGVYVARLQARNGTGGVVSATLRMVVNPIAAAQAPAASTSILVAGDRVWVLNPDHGSVAVFHADTRQRLAVHPVCSDPRSLARDGAGKIWIACRGDDRLVALNADGSAGGSLATGYGTAPAAVLFDAAGTTGYATLTGTRNVLRFTAATASENAPRVALGFAAEALARAGNRLYAARLKSADDAGRIAALDLASFTAVAGSSGNPGIALPLDTTSADSSTAGRGLPNYLAALAVSPDNSRVWFAAKKDNILRGVARENTELDFDKTVRVLIGTVDTAGASERVAARRDIDNSSLALALAPSPGGALLFVALAGNDRIVALDPWQGAEVARVDVGAAPRGLAVDAARGRLWVRNDIGRSVTVLDIAALSGQGTPSMPVLGTAASVTAEVLPASVLAGKRIFYRAEDARMSADAYIACASCHLDGGGDGRVWDFTQRGEGLRRTMPLNGRAGVAHGPLHWTANFDEVQDFEHDIREGFGGTGLMANAQFFANGRDTPMGGAKAGVSADLDALSAYVSSLNKFGRSPHRVDANTLSVSAAAGRTLFGQLGCARCHGGAAFTDSGSKRWHDVGTVAATDMRAGRVLQGFDTPTLRGLWHETRFMHDGRNADPLAALTTTPAGRHGAVGTLSDTQRQQLRDYLLSIDDNEPAAPAPFALQIAEPRSGEQADPGRPLQVTVNSDLAGLARIDALLDGVVVATDTAAPWQVEFAVTAGSRPQLQLRATHTSGAITYGWPQPVEVSSQIGGLFRNGFESP